MSPSTPSRAGYRAPLHGVLFTILLLLSGVGGGFLASHARHPGHADRAYYYTIAENLLDGRGLSVDYTWHYYQHWESISHPSNDYWMPLASFFMAAGMALFGQTVSAALLPSLLLLCALGVLAYKIARNVGCGPFGSNLVMAAVLFNPLFLKYSLLTNTGIYFAFFGAISLYCSIRGSSDTKYLVTAGLFAGMAHLTRQDGVLLLASIIVAPLLSGRAAGTRIKQVLAICIPYFIVVFPLIVRNVVELDSIFPEGPKRTFFFIQYEDLYAHDVLPNLSRYLSWGWGNIFSSKLRCAAVCGYRLIELSGGLLLPVLFVGLVLSIRNCGVRYFACHPAVLYLVTCFVFFSAIATFPGQGGSFEKGAMPTIPFLVSFAVRGLETRRKTGPALLLLLVIGISVYGIRGWTSAEKMIAAQTKLGRQLEQVAAILDSERAQSDREIVVMTRNPWEVYHTTRYRAIQIPNDDIGAIISVANHYRVSHLLLPAPREALRGLYEGTRNIPQFDLIADTRDGGVKVYRYNDIKSAPGTGRGPLKSPDR